MLEKLQKFALLLAPLRPFLLFGIMLFSGLFMLSALDLLLPAVQGVLVGSALAALWCLLLTCCVVGFRAVPQRVEQGMPLRIRLRLRVRRAEYWLLAWAALLVSLALAAVSLRLLLMLWVR